MLEIANIFQPLIDGGVTMLEFWHGVTGKWGVAIILLAFTLQLALFPLAFIGRSAVGRLDALQPELKELEERYAGDKERRNQEVMRLYERRGAVPPPPVFLLPLGVLLCFAYLFESQAFKDTIGGEPFLFLSDLAERLIDDPFALAAMIALSMGIAVVQRRLVEPTWWPGEPPSVRTWSALMVACHAFFIFFPAGFAVFLVAWFIWAIGEELVLNKLLPRPAPSVSEDV